MPRTRTLSLRREALTALAPESLADVVAGVQATPTTPVKYCLTGTGAACITDDYRTTCLNCE
jgi:hypothetical protein